MDPVLNPVAAVDRAFLFIIGVSLVMLLGITAAMIGFVIRYRRARHPVAADIRGHAGLEIAWMIIPTLIVLAMFAYGWQAYLGLRTVPPGALPIDVTAEMFFWTFTYPNGRQTDTLVVPEGQPVKLNLASRDVIHSLFIPAFRIKTDAVPGLKTYAWFYPNTKGTYTILCAEYCGVGHSAMYADLKIVSRADYEQWLARPEERRPAARGAPDAATQTLFDPAGMHSLEDAMTLRWRIEGPRLYVRLRAPAAGWVAVGFNPTAGMQDANFIVGYVEQDQVFISDDFGNSRVAHADDATRGGQSQIEHVFGTEHNGVTEIGFSLPLDSGEATDRRLDPDGETTVLLAYNATRDNFRSRHQYRAAFKVHLATGQCVKFSGAGKAGDPAKSGTHPPGEAKSELGPAAGPQSR